MTRLTHPPSAYYRSMQISRKGVYIFVEGKKNDPYIYNEIVKTIADKNEHRVCSAHELPWESGGKQTLIEFFQYLSTKSALVDEFKGKTTVSLFYLDKDIDDLLDETIESNHIVYTKYYEIENRIFQEGNIIKAGAICTSTTEERVEEAVGDETEWMKNAAESWKEWVKLCVFTRREDLDYKSNYRVLSEINNNRFGKVDKKLFEDYLSDLEARSEYTSEEFKKAFDETSRQVESVYSDGDFNKVFKGKWYVQFLSHTLRMMENSSHVNTGGLEARIVPVLIGTLNFEDDWTNYFKAPLENILSSL